MSDSSGGLSPHPAEPERRENVEAEAEVSEAAERKQCPEGRGGWKRQTCGGENPARGRELPELGPQ